MNPKTLDHVAYWLADRDAVADFVVGHLGMHVIDRTDAFTLVGADARHGKLTLFAADGPRERGALEHVALRVGDLDRALAELSDGPEVERRREGEAYFELGEGVAIGLVQADTDLDYDLDHVALRSADPQATASEYGSLGFRAAAPGPSGCPRVEVGGAWIEFQPGKPGAPEQPLLNHLVGQALESIQRVSHCRGLRVQRHLLAVALSNRDRPFLLRAQRLPGCGGNATQERQ